MKANKIIYWIATALFSAGMLMSSSMYLTQNPKLVEAFHTLGYPLFFMYILGLAKGLGAIALLVPRFPKLKEWAYAGFSFTLIGAIWTHVATGTSFSAVIIFGVLLLVSYLFYNRVQNTKKITQASVASLG